jgi:hypothetical protein
MNIKKSWLALVACLQGLLLLTGCDALYSSKVNPSALPNSPTKPTPGYAFYYLPKVELMLTAVLTNAPSTNVLASAVNIAMTNISITTVSNYVAPIGVPLTLVISTNFLTLGTTNSNFISLTLVTNQLTLVPQTNGVILNANTNSSKNLALPLGTSVLGKITTVTTTNSVTFSDNVNGSLTLVAGTNYLHISPQSGNFLLITSSGPPAWTDTTNYLTLYPTNVSAIPQTGPTTIYFNQMVSVASTNWIPVSSTNWFYAITVTNFFTPEPQAMFSLNIAPDYLGEYSETYGIQVDNNGFIQSVNSSNADQTVQIVTEIAQAVGAIMGLPPTPAAYISNNVSQVKQPASVSVIFDPTSAQSINIANSLIAQKFGNSNSIVISSEWAPANPLSSPDLENDSYLAEYTKPFCGIAYRPLKPYIVDVLNTRAQFDSSLQQYLVMSPNQSTVLSMPIKRAPFVTRTTSLTFNNGLFVSANYSRPSIAAAIFGLPATVINAYLSSVTNLLQLKLNIATGQAAIQQQNADLINATTNLLQAEQVLQKMQASATNSTVAP